MAHDGPSPLPPCQWVGSMGEGHTGQHRGQTDEAPGLGAVTYTAMGVAGCAGAVALAMAGALILCALYLIGCAL